MTPEDLMRAADFLRSDAREYSQSSLFESKKAAALRGDTHAYRQSHMFLTADELYILTGYKRFSEQRACLDQNAVPYFVAGSGRPVVLKANIEQRTIRPDGPQKNTRLRLAAQNASSRR